jgi:C_GCAxxG_C_C family probable redox protein
MTSQDTKDIVHSELQHKVSDYLSTCGNCAQTSFLALQEYFELEDGSILKALTPFPGIALRGETCGAVVGSMMAIGLVYGRDKEDLDKWSSYIRSLPPARKFCRSFEAEYGSTMCGEVVERQFGRRFNLADSAESMEWLGEGAIEKCGAVISTAVGIAAEIIQLKKADICP